MANKALFIEGIWFRKFPISSSEWEFNLGLTDNKKRFLDYLPYGYIHYNIRTFEIAAVRDLKDLTVYL